MQAVREVDDLVQVVFDSVSGDVLAATRYLQEEFDIGWADARRLIRTPGEILAQGSTKLARGKRDQFQSNGLKCHLEQVEQNPWAELDDAELERRIFERGWVSLPPDERARWLQTVRLLHSEGESRGSPDRAGLTSL